MNARDEVAYRLALSEGFLAEAEQAGVANETARQSPAPSANGEAEHGEPPTASRWTSPI